MIVTLQRMGSTPWGTFGTLWVPDMAPLYTLEPVWRSNAPGVSCIPHGEYPVEYVEATERWHITQVPGRTAIQFHVGNHADNTEGCILPGTYMGVIDGTPGVAQSASAMTLLRQAFERAGSNIWLSVTWDQYDWRAFV